jgi:hypothetical protein
MVSLRLACHCCLRVSLCSLNTIMAMTSFGVAEYNYFVLWTETVSAISLFLTRLSQTSSQNLMIVKHVDKEDGSSKRPPYRIRKLETGTYP